MSKGSQLPVTPTKFGNDKVQVAWEAPAEEAGSKPEFQTKVAEGALEKPWSCKGELPAKVAALLDANAPLEELRSRQDWKICVEADLKFFGAERKLVVVRCHEPPLAPDHIASQLEELIGQLHDLLRDCRAPRGCGAETWLWPLHGSSAARIELQEKEFLGYSRGQPCWLRLLNWMHVWAPYGGSDFVMLVRDMYGAASGYSFAASHFLVQKLWVLFWLAVVLKAAGASAHAGNAAQVVLWQIGKVLIWLWGVWVAYLGQDRLRVLAWSLAADPTVRVRNPSYRSGQTFTEYLAVTLLFAWPIRLVFLMLVMFVVLMHMQFNSWLTYIHGGCLYKKECDFIFGNFLLGLLSDIALAGLFEALKELAKVIGRKLTEFENYEWEEDHELASRTCSMVLTSFSKVGSFALFAFLFVPQWSRQSDTKAVCNDTWVHEMFGGGSLLCLGRRMSQKKRIDLFEGAMTGPYVIGPFINILFQVVVPFIAKKLDKCSRSRTPNVLSRLIATLFVYDCGSIGCLRFATSGWPWRDIRVASEPMCDDEPGVEGMDLVDRAMEQCALRAFTPMDELLELKLGFLSMLFYAPCRPELVFPFLAARLLESHSDLTKLLFVRRRKIPNTAILSHKSQRVYLLVAVIVALPWSVGLSLFTYNPNLYIWISGNQTQS